MPSSTRSPRLDALLKRLRDTLVRQIWLHGIGTTLAALAGWLLFAFLADWLLHVPAPVRIFHTVVMFALPAALLGYSLFRWLRRVPDRAGLAQLIERSHPELNEVLVSAVQLDGEGKTKAEQAAAPLIEHVVQEAEAKSASVDLGRVVLPSGPRRRFALGALASVVCILVLALQPALSGIFLRRMFGADVRWPQRTHLAIEIPVVGDRARVETDENGIYVRVARGSDLPVLVRAEGVVPDEVTLHFSTGHRSVLSSGGTELFRTLLRSVQEDVEFSVTGGDDTDREPSVHLTVLQPPDIAGLALQITPPTYSGLPERLEREGDVEVLAGSKVSVFVLADPPSATGVARMLPEGTAVELEPATFPSPTEGDPEQTEGHGFSFVADRSVRYRFELVDDTGLPNPDPGLYGVQVVEDRRPGIHLISPGRAEVDVVQGGAIPLRVRVEDDFGTQHLTWQVKGPKSAGGSAGSAEEALLATEALDPRPISPGSSGAAGDPSSLPDSRPGSTLGSTLVFARTRLKVSDLGGDEPLSEGSQVTLQILAYDNREPEPNESFSAPVRLRVVSIDEFQRRLQDSLARAGEQAGRLSRLQVEKQRRTSELLAALSSDELDSGDRAQITSLSTGQKRVQGDARALGRELSAIAESLLYSGIDERSGPLLEAIDESLGAFTDRAFHHEPWVELARRYEAGELGSAGLAGQLIKIVGTGLAISEEHTASAERALGVAQAATGPAARRDALDLAYRHQARAVEEIERLLEQLAEWDNYQSILSLTRDLVNRQKNLTERTRNFARDN